MLKKSDLIVVVVMIFGVIGFLYWKKQSRPVAAPVVVSEPTSTTLSTTPETPADPAPPSEVSVTSPARPKSLGEPGDGKMPFRFFDIKDPFCRNAGRSDGFAFLPSLFLREFYTQRNSWVALPQDMASCFVSGKSLTVYFSEFRGDLQMPWDPLVKMQARVEKVQEFAALTTLEKEVNFKNYNFVGNRCGENFQECLRKVFSEDLAKPWVLIRLSHSGLEDRPSYWPKLPPVHVLARYVPAASVKSMVLDQGARVVDARAPQEGEKFKLPFQAEVFKPHQIGSGIFRMEPGAFEPWRAKEFAKIPRSQTLILVGRDDEDQNAFNAANFLALTGFQSLYIVTEGARGFGGPSSVRPVSTGPWIEARELKELKARDRSLAIIDCRNPGFVRSSIQGAMKVTFKRSGEEQRLEGVDTEALIRELQQNKPGKIVVFGANSLDPKPVEVQKALSVLGVPISILKDGFDSWRFMAAYKWNEELVERDRRAGSSPPPPRKQVAEVPAKPLRLDPAKPAGSVEPTRLTPEEIEKIRKSRSRARAGREGKNQSRRTSPSESTSKKTEEP